MPLVVEFVKSGAERVVVFQVKIMHFRFRSGVPAVFANIHLKKSHEHVIGAGNDKELTTALTFDLLCL